jgi:hypothetical protein
VNGADGGRRDWMGDHPDHSDRRHGQGGQPGLVGHGYGLRVPARPPALTVGYLDDEMDSATMM